MKAEFLIVHHTASSQDRTTVEDVDRWHKVRWPDFKSSKGYYVGYHYLIEANKMTQTREDNEVGAHTLGGYNYKSIGICLTGNYDIDYKLTPFQQTTLGQLLNKLSEKHGISEKNVIIHRSVWATACPGKNIDEKFVRSLMALPVDDRYAQKRRFMDEVKIAFTPWLIRQIKRLPNNREIKGLVYGHWSFNEIFRNAVGTDWHYKVK